MNKSLVLWVCSMIICFYSLAQQPMMEVKSDGKYIADPAVSLTELKVDVKIYGQLAITTMELLFTNAHNREMEGQFTFPLPEGAGVYGFALDINGVMREAVPVEKERAKEVFESLERRNIDPAIIEKLNGNVFRTRVYPLPAGGSRRLSIAYQQTLIQEQQETIYYLPISLKNIARFTLATTVYESSEIPQLVATPEGFRFAEGEKKVWTAAITKTNYTTAANMKIVLPATGNVIREALMEQQEKDYYFLNNVNIPASFRKRMLPGKIGVIWDNSLSGLQRDIEKEKKILMAYLQHAKEVEVQLFTINMQQCAQKVVKVINGDTRELQDALDELVYDGGTDLGALHAFGAQEYLLFTDGIATYGDFKMNINVPVHTIATNPVTDFGLLRYISNHTAGIYVNATMLDVAKAVNHLINEPLRIVSWKGNNTVDIFPQTGSVINGLMTIAGKSIAASGTIIMEIGYGNEVTSRIPVSYKYKESTAANWPVSFFWAQQKVNALEADFTLNKEEVKRLGKQFGIVTRNTSLIVLDDIADYVKYEIVPPVEMRTDYYRLLNEEKKKRTSQHKNRLEKAIVKVGELKDWWGRDFSNRKTHKNEALEEVVVLGYGISNARMDMTTAPIQQQEALGWSGEVEDNRKKKDIRGYVPSTGKISLVAVEKKAPYLQQLDKLSLDAAYRKYLNLRKEYHHAPVFYLDIAQWFFEKKDTARGELVLSNLTELDMESSELYKKVAYVLRENGLYAKAKWITAKVLEWSPMYVQSYRDYAIVLQENGEYQQALDYLMKALLMDVDEQTAIRDKAIEEVLLMEINNLVSLHKKKLNLTAVDKRLLTDLPVDIRVVLNWNTDHVDIDLWVTDPDGEKCSYQQKETAAGGRISDDITDGLGPEQFLLKKAKKGKYEIQTNLFADRQLSLTGGTTIVGEVYLNYSSGRQEKKLIVFNAEKMNSRNEKKDMLLIATFEF